MKFNQFDHFMKVVYALGKAGISFLFALFAIFLVMSYDVPVSNFNIIIFTVSAAAGTGWYELRRAEKLEEVCKL